jgi:hypothetical protein
MSRVLFLVVLVAAAAVRAAPSPTSTAPVAMTTAATPDRQLFLRSTNILRYNPLGLISDNVLSLRHRLYRADDVAALRDNFVGIGLTPQVSAAFARVGLLAEVQPLSILRLWMNAEVVGYFGSFGLLQSFPSPTADFRDATIASRGQLPAGDPQKNFATGGTQLTVGMDLQMKAGPVVARNLTRVVRGSYALRPGDTVYYDQFYDVLAANDGLFVNNDTDLLWSTSFGLVAGVRANVTQPFYAADDYSAAEQAVPGGPRTHPNGPTLRAGPLLSWTFYDDPTALVNKPTIIVIGNWWIAHRYRAGADIPQAIPYTVVAFQFSSDLYPHLFRQHSGGQLQ